jgi:hypothetical protein
MKHPRFLILACALALMLTLSPSSRAAASVPATETPAKKTAPLLGPNLSYLRVHALPRDQGTLAAAAAGNGTIKLDLRFKAADADASNLFFGWLKSRARVSAPVLVLMNTETSPALLTPLRGGHLPPGVVTLGIASPGLTLDVPVEGEPAADRTAYDALEHGASLEDLVNPKVDKIRHDEAAMARERAAGATAAEPDDSSTPEAEEKPASATPAAPTLPIDRVLQRAVQLQHALQALHKIP